MPASMSSLLLSLLPAPRVYIRGRALTSSHACVRYRLHIVGERVSEIHNCLLGLPGTRREDVRHVISDAMALSHCDAFVRGLPGVVRQAVDDTAQAAKIIAENGWRSGSTQTLVWFSLLLNSKSSALSEELLLSTLQNGGCSVWTARLSRQSFDAGMLQPSGARGQQSCMAWK